MRSGRNKRSRNNKDPDSDLYTNVAGDDTHSDSYSRSHSSFHIPESYRAPPNMNRAPYPSEPDVPSRSRRNDEWHLPELNHNHDRYSYNDVYGRGERVGYDDVGPRSSEGWGTVDVPQYPPTRNEWPQRYDRSTPSSSYTEPSSWGITPSNAYDSSHVYHDRWKQRDVRDLPPEKWIPGPVRTDQRADPPPHDWHHDQRRDKNTVQRFQSDSGWETRRERMWGREPVGGRDDLLMPKRPHPTQDRSWEPAASWKSSTNGDHQHQRGQNGQRSNQSRTKRGQNSKHRREWRADDGDLNNWTRRDANQSTNRHSYNQNHTRRKNPRSPSRSRSRSRSPTDSYISHHSSRGRSRSRSFSPAPKRRRRDSSPVTFRSLTPSDRGLNRQLKHQEKYHSRTPSPHRSPGSAVDRRRSASPASSLSSDRSVSQSPASRTRSLHRLPAMNQGAAALTNTLSKSSGSGSVSRISEDPRNGRSRHRQHRKVYDSHSIQDPPLHPTNREDYAQTPTPPVNINHNLRTIAIQMPPPSLPPPFATRPHHRDSQSGTSYTPEPKIDSSTTKPTRAISMRNAGFKPIDKASSALKKFFPGDEDDMDLTVDGRPPSVALGMSIPTTETPRLPSPQQNNWRNSHDPRKDDGHVLPHRPHEAPVESEARYSSISVHSNPRHFSAPVVSTANLLQVRASPPIDITKESERLTPQPMELSDDILPLNETQASPPETVEVPIGSSSGSSSKELYKIVSQVGEGTFGKVYKARNTLTGTHVALKRIRMESERDGFPVTAMREIKLLQSLRHENIVRLFEMMVSNGAVYMVFEYMDHDLTGVLSQSQFTFSDAHLKSLCHQMLAGLAYLHHKGVIHRDIKGSNILINRRGELKLGDFGLARFYQKRRRTDYTNRVITLWYRPPELLFGATVYGPEVDMWSAGCIMLELFTKKPVFQGSDEINQLDVVFRLMGTPTSERWADIINLPWYELVKPQHVIPNRFREAFQRWMSPAALDLAEQLLAYDPSQRVTALQAMDAPYFTEETPSASRPVGLVGLEGEWHELETKRERAKRGKKEREERHSVTSGAIVQLST